MSRLQAHRKSQSTSALSILAEGGVSGVSEQGGRRRHRASQHPSLGVVQETGVRPKHQVIPQIPPSPHVTQQQVQQQALPSIPRSESIQERSVGMERRFSEHKTTVEEVRSHLNDIMSLRSSERRRTAALRGLEKAMVGCCIDDDRRKSQHGSSISGSDNLSLKAFVGFQVHNALINLLTRHAQTLTTSRSAKDVTGIVNELVLVAGILQGLCLLSRACRDAMGESYVLEILIDLLLLLRTQPPPAPSTPTTPTSGSSSIETHSIVYSMLDLLCCILVDSPLHARTFERLSGLEAVVRVLKGTGVAKEIRMKCLEFLYFYLLPENSPGSSRAVSAASQASASSSSSGESLLYPPSPLSSSTSSLGSGSDGRISPSPLPHLRSSAFVDLDIPFIPQTPKKPPKPSLGYLTPSTHHRRVSGSMSITSTPSLAPVPASPRNTPKKDIPTTPSKGRDGTERNVDSRRWSVMEPPTPNPGLGLGLPKSSSVSTNLAAEVDGGMKRDVTAIKLDQLSENRSRPGFIDPFDSRHSSSGSSTVVPSRQASGMSRSNTQPSLSILSSSSSGSSGLQRRVSARRSGKSPLIHEVASPKTGGDVPSSPAKPSRRESLAPSRRESLAPSRRESLAVSSRRESSGVHIPQSSSSRNLSDGPRPPKVRHSRTQSHLSGLLPTAGLPPPVPRVPSIHRHTPSIPDIPETPKHRDVSRDQGETTPQPTPAKRAFPVELTRGLPPSASSPALSAMSPHRLGGGTPVIPLGPSRRIPSHGERLVESRAKGKDGGEGVKKPVKTVEEKKELLSSWLGNVDALVQGVEKVSFWSSVQKGRRG